MPGGLCLAIASSACDTAIEIRTPPYKLKNDTVTGKTPG